MDSTPLSGVLSQSFSTLGDSYFGNDSEFDNRSPLGTSSPDASHLQADGSSSSSSSTPDRGPVENQGNSSVDGRDYLAELLNAQKEVRLQLSISHQT